jgi:hypothetical protein
MRTIPARTAACLGRVRRHSLSDLVAVFGEWVGQAPANWKSERDRLYWPLRTFWLFLSQVVAGNVGCAETVSKAMVWLGLKDQEEASQNTGAYCRARQRLEEVALQELADSIAKRMEGHAGEKGLWYGRRVEIVDGTSASMPDTPANQNEWPQPSSQKEGCGFPVVRLVALSSLATGAILRIAHAALSVGEHALFRQLWQYLEPAVVLLADCGFTSFANVHLLRQRGVDIVMRNHQRRSTGVRLIERLSRRDNIVAWKKTGRVPKWLDRQTWAALPHEITVRQIEVTVDIPGFRPERIVIVTTLLDPKAFPKDAFADLYRKRWYAELFLRDIKTTLHMDVLKCKSPAMIRRELQMFIIAYNLVRALMLQAALLHNVPPLRISFKGSLGTLRQWAPILAMLNSPESLDDMTRLLLSYLAKDIIPDRPDRVEPRARKRRPKNYPLLNKPRHQYKEIPHRNRYKKP